MVVSPLQLVNLHRNRRYFVIKLHTWFCLSYFLKTNIQFYCICQYFMSINSFSTPYLFLDTAARLQWPVTQISTFQQFFFLIMLFDQATNMIETKLWVNGPWIVPYQVVFMWFGNSNFSKDAEMICLLLKVLSNPIFLEPIE